MTERRPWRHCAEMAPDRRPDNRRRMLRAERISSGAPRPQRPRAAEAPSLLRVLASLGSVKWLEQSLIVIGALILCACSDDAASASEDGSGGAVVGNSSGGLPGGAGGTPVIGAGGYQTGAGGIVGGGG